MSKKTLALPLISVLLTLMMIGMAWETALGEGFTNDPWPSFRHDLLNSGAATDSGYPTTNFKLWMIDREPRSWDQDHPPAGSRGPSVVDKGMVFTAGTGVVQANDQFDRESHLVKILPLEERAGIEEIEPAGAPTDWCYNDIPALEGNTGICYVENMVDCPSWCFECTTDEPDLSRSPHKSAPFPPGYDSFSPALRWTLHMGHMGQ